MRACAGFRRENESCAPPATSTSSLLSRENSLRSALQNKRLIYRLLFHTSAATLLEIARDPRPLGAEIGFFSVLHTWDPRPQHHPHVHCVLAARGITPDHSLWISSRRIFLPSRQSAQPCFPRQVCRRTQGRLSCGRTPVPRASLTACGTARLRLRAAATVSARLGRLLQAVLRWARTRSALSRLLDPPRRHCQQQVGCSLRGQPSFPPA